MLQPELEIIVNQIEAEYHKVFASNSENYIKHYRQLIFNINDKDNDTFYLKVLTGKITPEQLPKMKNEEMASDERTAERQKVRDSDIEQRVNFSNEIAKNRANMVLKKTLEKGLPQIDEDDCREVLHSLSVNENKNNPKPVLVAEENEKNNDVFDENSPTTNENLASPKIDLDHNRIMFTHLTSTV